MRHHSNILQLVTHTTLERPVRHSQRDSLVNMAWLCTQYKVPMVCVQSQGFHGVVWCRSTLFPMLPSWGFLPGTWVEVPYLGVWKGPIWCVLGWQAGACEALSVQVTWWDWCLGNQLLPTEPQLVANAVRTCCGLFSTPGTVSIGQNALIFFSCTMWEIDSQLEWLFFFFCP